MTLPLLMIPLSLVNLLYYLSFILLLGMAAFVLIKKPTAWLHRCFALTALSLLAWQVTLFLYNHAQDPSTLLWLGRANFAAIVFVVFFSWMLVRAIAGLPLPKSIKWLLVEIIALAAATAFTPLVDQAEATTTTGVVQHTTQYGPLFPLYLLHAVAYLLVAVLTAFRVRDANLPSRPSYDAPVVRDQLLLVGMGMLATGLVALVTNVLLPFGFGNFRYNDVGTLSTILFLAAVAYAIVKHHLFDIRLLVRKTLVYGLLLSLVLAAYSAVALLVTDHLAQDSASGLTRFGVLLIAFSFDPIRRFLEKRIDGLLFRQEHHWKQTSNPRRGK